MTTLTPRQTAMNILRKYGIWWNSWNDVREHVLTRNPEAAKKALVEKHEFEPNDADCMLTWLEGSIYGTNVELVEIPISSIRAPTGEEMTEEDDEDDDEDNTDPFELPQYLARRGVYIGKMEVIEWDDGGPVQKVWFNEKSINPNLLDQVWQITPAPEA